MARPTGLGQADTDSSARLNKETMSNTAHAFLVSLSVNWANVSNRFFIETRVSWEDSVNKQHVAVVAAHHALYFALVDQGAEPCLAAAHGDDLAWALQVQSLLTVYRRH